MIRGRCEYFGEEWQQPSASSPAKMNLAAVLGLRVRSEEGEGQ
jgi:hypothetical protein